MCSPVCSSTVIGCTYDIPTGIYSMYVYDIEEEGTLSDDWAISSTNITITGLEPSPSITTVSFLTVIVTKGTSDYPSECNIHFVITITCFQLSVTCPADTLVHKNTSCVTAALGGM